ncbi:MAG: DUF4058 family protein [Planctomycetes bacterium]|nr:DUF4058 family protein [Planctomycetota bacterium]
MPIHDWTRVSVGEFHAFHNSWLAHLQEALNSGILPDGCYALAEQRARDVTPDVLTLKRQGSSAPATPVSGSVAVAEAPPKVKLRMKATETAMYRLARRTLVIRHASGDRIIALVEVVSPANKDRPASVEDFVDKAVGALQLGYHLVVIDLHPASAHDPRGMHGKIWEQYDEGGYLPPATKPLTAASYAVNGVPEAFVEPLAVGDKLPEMPLFLDPRSYVNLPLEPTYQAAFRGLPKHLQALLEGKA